jgi:RNA polymerase sigma-70 factor (ECF subfamily)
MDPGYRRSRLRTPGTSADAPPGLADEEVVARVLAGDGALFEVLMRRYNQRLYRTARAIVRDEAEAEDVMQETYTRAYAALGQFEGRAQWSTWLTRIAVNESLARVRRGGRFVSREAVGEEDLGDGRDTEQSPMNDERQASLRRTGPEAMASARELGGFLERAIDELPDTYRTVFVLREVEELSTAETAACLDITEELVKVRLHRARNELRRLLDERLGAATREVFDFHASRCDRVVAAVFGRLGIATSEP